MALEEVCKRSPSPGNEKDLLAGNIQLGRSGSQRESKVVSYLLVDFEQCDALFEAGVGYFVAVCLEKQRDGSPEVGSKVEKRCGMLCERPGGDGFVGQVGSICV